MIALVVITDGRIDYLRRTLASAVEMLDADWDARIIVDDSGDPDHAAAIVREWPRWESIHTIRRAGFAATVRAAWQAAIDAGATHVWHQEDDFLINQPLRVDWLQQDLDANPRLAQIALKRQPVNAIEEAAGGFMEMWPADWRWQQGGLVEHVVTFTTNPCLIPAHAIRCALASPEPLTEPEITRQLRAAGYRFAFLGALDDPPLVTHIGEHRSAAWQQ